MSRFADPNATRTVVVGPCECPGTPHADDTVTVQAEMSSFEVETFFTVDQADEVAVIAEFLKHVRTWNFLGPDGREVPVTAEALRSLKQATLAAVAGAVGAVAQEGLGLPNPSSDPSPGSQPESPSPIPTLTPTPGT